MLTERNDLTRRSNRILQAHSRGRALAEHLVRLGLVMALLAGMILVLPAAPAAAGSRVPAPTPNELSISDASMKEGDSGEAALVFTVTRKNPGGISSVEWYTKDGTASSKEPDYASASGGVKFLDGETSKTVSIKVYGDTEAEKDETFTVNLQKTLNATIVDGQGVGTILDDDSAATPNELSIDDVSLEEGDNGDTYFKFTITRKNPSGSSSVAWYTKDGTASSKEPDYAPASGAVKFLDGETVKTVEIKIYGDTNVEGDETFTVNLEKPTNATIVDGQGVGTILDDDGSTGDTWDKTGSLNTTRGRHTATRLDDGRVLVTGGYDGKGITTSAEIYDPTSGTWATTGPMAGARNYHTATRLHDGRVLVAGGSNLGPLSTVEIYDPKSGTWTAASPLGTARYYHTATRLHDGRVLVAGGYSDMGDTSSAEIYDPKSGKWTTANPMGTARRDHTATRLNDGRVLVTGGYDGKVRTTSVEIYDPTSGKWTAVNPLAIGRDRHTATLLKDGRVLVVGGIDSKKAAIGSPEIYDPSSGKWATANPLATARTGHTATLLYDGRVLVSGGDDMNKARAVIVSSEIYDPDTGTWSASLDLNVARTNHTATLLGDGRVLATGGWSTSGIVGSSELHDGPTPTAVSLLSFSAEVAGGTIRLQWETATEVNNLGFNVYRQAADGERVRLNTALIPCQNLGSVVGAVYEFVDEDVEPGAAYDYWLEDIDLNGSATMHGPASATVKLYLQKPLPVRRRLPPPLPIEPGPLPPVGPPSEL